MLAALAMSTEKGALIMKIRQFMLGYIYLFTLYLPLHDNSLASRLAVPGLPGHQGPKGSDGPPGIKGLPGPHGPPGKVF